MKPLSSGVTGFRVRSKPGSVLPSKAITQDVAECRLSSSEPRAREAEVPLWPRIVDHGAGAVERELSGRLHGAPQAGP